MHNNQRHRPLFALPNHLYGFLRHCPHTLNALERAAFLDAERNRQRGHNVRVIYNQTVSPADDEFVLRIIAYANWLQHLRDNEGTDRPLRVAVVSRSKERAANLATLLPGQVISVGPRGIDSLGGKTFDLAIILHAHALGRIQNNLYQYTSFQKALSTLHAAPVLFILGQFNPHSHLQLSFHAHYRRCRKLCKEEPSLRCVYDYSDPPEADPLPKLRPRPEDLGGDEEDTEILLGFQIGLDPGEDEIFGASISPPPSRLTAAAN